MTKGFNWERPANLAVFGAAIRREREKQGRTLDTLAALTGISKPYLSNIETARAPGPPLPDKLRQIAQALGLDEGRLLAGADWLRTPESVRRAVEAMGKGARAAETTGAREWAAVASTLKRELQAPPPPRREDGAIDLDRLVGAAARREKGAAMASGRSGRRGAEEAEILPLRPVPMINRVAAGQAAEFTDLDYPAGVADSYVPVPDLPEAPVAAAFAVRVRGDSMMPEYAEGEILIVGPPSPAGGGDDAIGVLAEDGQDCVVRLGEMEHFATTFKRVFYVRDAAGEVTGLRLVPLNPAHTERRVKLEQVTGVYPVMYRLVKPARAGGVGLGKAAKEKFTEPAPPPASFTTTRVAIEND